MDPELGPKCNPLPSMTTVRNKFQLQRLRRRLRALEGVMFDPQCITLEGCDNLRGIPGQDWKSRIYGLFTDTRLPHVYILNMHTDDIANIIPNKITIEIVSYCAKCFVYRTLHNFLIQQKKNFKISKN
jgi:hypothetical protein